MADAVKGASPLTAEERALVEGCIGLTYQVARNWWKRMKRSGVFLDDDEFVAVCYTAICRAAQTFRAELGFKFTTHATAAMHFRCVEHADFLRGYRKGWRNGMRGGKQRLPGQMTFGLCRVEYARAAPDDGRVERAEARERAGLVLDRMDERTREAANLKARGATLKTIGAAIGGPRGAVSRERARQVLEEAGRSGVLRSWAGR